MQSSRHGGWEARTWLWAALLLAVFAPPAAAVTFDFEALIDSAILTNQYAGAVFTNAIVLGAGITLDEFEFPAHAGANVASDNGGPITITFSSPLRRFSGYFTYSTPLTVQAFDSSNNLIVSTNSSFASNEALSGVSGSQPNEFLQVNSSTVFAKIVITGAAHGSSFTMDDITAVTRCDLNLDGITTVADVQAIVNEVLGAAPALDDLNSDGQVNVADAQIVVNAALGGTCTAH